MSYRGYTRSRALCKKEKAVDGKNSDLDLNKMSMYAFGVLKIPPDAFWNMTLHEFNMAMKGFQVEHSNDIYLYWINAYLNMIGFHNPKQFPKFNSMFKDDDEARKKQEENRAFFESILAKKRRRK